MPIVTWTFVPATTPVQAIVVPPLLIQSVSNPLNLPTESDVAIGSKSWLLLNKDGTVDFVSGEMDIVFNYGHVQELRDPAQVLDQRLRKTVMEIKGKNRFSPDLGTRIRQLLGTKDLAQTTLKEIGKSLRELVDTMIDLQNETMQRIHLDDAEIIDHVDAINLVSEAGVISVQVNVVTRAGTTQQVSASL